MTQPNQPGAPGQQPVPTPGAIDPNDPAFKQATQANFLDVFNPLGGLERVIQYDAQYLAASGSGKFQIDPAEIQPLLAHWQEAINRLNSAQRLAEALKNVDGPGDEDASSNMATGANQSGQAYIEHNKELIKYCQAEQDKLRSALQRYQQNEEHNAQHASTQYRK